MKHILFALTLSLVPLAAVSGAKGRFTTADSGIVTPDIATGMRAYSRFNNDVNGNMVVCLPDNETRSGDCKPWTPIQSVVPAGKTYVGFRVVSRRSLEVYWK